MSTIKIALTGHRPNKLGGYDLQSPLNQLIYQKLTSVIEQALTEHDEVIGISGMALGADTLWALALLEAQKQGKPVQLYAYIPCDTQPKLWPYKARQQYYHICRQASHQRKFSMSYNFSCMQKRNEGMIDDCDLLVAVYNGSHGGTYNAVQYAKISRPELPIICFNPDILGRHLKTFERK